MPSDGCCCCCVCVRVRVRVCVRVRVLVCRLQIVVGTSGHFSDVVPSLAQIIEQNIKAEEREAVGTRHKFHFVDHSLKQKYRALGGSHIAREVPKP